MSALSSYTTLLPDTPIIRIARREPLPLPWSIAFLTKGWLTGLVDLNTEKLYVQDPVVTYIDVISPGASEFRVDVAKHIGLNIMAQTYVQVKLKLGGRDLLADFISWNEVILGNEKGLLACGGGKWSWYTNFNTVLSSAGFSNADTAEIKVQSSEYLKGMSAWGLRSHLLRVSQSRTTIITSRLLNKAVEIWVMLAACQLRIEISRSIARLKSSYLAALTPTGGLSSC